MPEWLMQLLVGAGIISLGGMVWKAHNDRDNERFKDMWDQIGRESQAGMRKTTHDAYNMGLANKGLIDQHDERLKRIERYLNGHLK